MSQPHPTLLCILDGLGLNPRKDGNALANARTPVLDKLRADFPNSTLITHGERVGLPEGQMGNSEVGHLNIGAGRVVEQSLLRISRGLGKGTVFTSQVWQEFTAHIETSPTIHLIGLFSDGGVHSHTEHFHLLLDKLIADSNAGKFAGPIVLHIITDGRDCSPTAGLELVSSLETRIANTPKITIGSVIGRFFAMDRDTRAERTSKAYDAIILGKGTTMASASNWLATSYENGTYDEFIEPGITTDYKGITPSDAVIFWNFRADRMRQLVNALVLEPGFTSIANTLHFDASRTLTFTEYDATFPVAVLFAATPITNYLGAVVAEHGLQQLRAAETEKYPHVTYFLNGGNEAVLPGEKRVLVPSPRDVPTYDLKPEMSAVPLTDQVLDAIANNNFTFVCINFANCDMVGHTGVLAAAITAVETVDTCLGRILAAVLPAGWRVVVIADHGNAEQMISYEDGSPYTSHTTFPVPIIIADQNWPDTTPPFTIAAGGALCDVAPTVLQLIGLPQPEDMTGQSLLEQSA